MTNRDYVQQQIDAGLWEQTQAQFGRNALALDFYYRIYSLVEEFYPSRPYGYATLFVHNEVILNRLGGGYSQNIRFPEVLEPYTVRKAVMVMERKFVC